jgi:VCBS repeat protein/centrosomal CEP192-like protein
VEADFNGDGFVDLAVANGRSNNVSILLNNKAGGFKVTGPYPTGTRPYALVAGNFTLKGHIDLAVVNYTDSSLSILANDGTGKFGSPVTTALAAGASPDAITAGDFNNDGELDLAIGNSNNTVSLLLNNHGTFPTHTELNVSSVVLGIDNASLRANGVLDLLVAVGNVVDVFLGNNNGTFANPVSYPTGVTSTSVTTGDAHHDGLLDLLVSNANDSTVAILPGKGDGTFGAYIRFGTDVQPQVIVAGDFNNDGFLDFITANVGRTFTAYMNTPAAAIAPTRLSFPVTQLAVTSKPKTTTLYNSGIATLTPSAKISGDFAISSNGCTNPVLSGANCSVSATFTPTDIDTRAGALTFTDNATVNTQKVALTGTGTEVKLVPTKLSFGTVKVGQTSSPQTVTVTNISTVNSVTFSSIGLGGTDAGDFLISSNSCPPPSKSLGPGKSCKVGMEFKPTVVGVRNALLAFTDDGGGSPQNVPLSGTGN